MVTKSIEEATKGAGGVSCPRDHPVQSVGHQPRDRQQQSDTSELPPLPIRVSKRRKTSNEQPHHRHCVGRDAARHEPRQQEVGRAMYDPEVGRILDPAIPRPIRSVRIHQTIKYSVQETSIKYLRTSRKGASNQLIRRCQSNCGSRHLSSLAPRFSFAKPPTFAISQALGLANFRVIYCRYVSLAAPSSPIGMPSLLPVDTLRLK